MRSHKKYQKQLTLYIYDELNGAERADLEAHLQVCSRCRTELQELRHLQSEIPAQSMIEPDEQTMKTLRNTVSHKLRARTKPGRTWFPVSIKMPSYALQGAFALALLLTGFFVGRQTVSSDNGQEALLETLLTANRQVNAQNGAIDPYLAGVERLSYNPQTGNIEIYYNTVNDIRLQGNLQNPVVREMVRLAMLEQNSPSVRLHAVKTVGAIAEKQQTLGQEYIQALTFLLEKEQNPGVRLQVLRVLKAVPMTPVLRTMMIQTLLNDRNQALRIEVFDILTAGDVSRLDINDFLDSLKDDTNQYLRFRANDLIEQFDTIRSQDQIRTKS